MRACSIVGFGAVLSAAALAGAGGTPAKPQASRPANNESWAYIGAIHGIDTKTQHRVDSILWANGIGCRIESTVVCCFEVAAANKDRAIAILKADAAREGYWIKFSDGTQSPQKLDMEAKAQWEKALAQAKPGMGREQLLHLLELLDPMGGWGENRNQPSTPLSVLCQLDVDWYLRVAVGADHRVSEATIEPAIKLAPGNLPDLRKEIPDNLYGLVEAINQAPRVRGSTFDPAFLIRAVNTLHAAGFDRATEAMEAYLRLCEKDPRRNLDYGLDERKMFFIVRLLFVRKDGTAQMPNMLKGDGGAAPLLDRPALPLFPLIVESDVPFMLAEDYLLAGEPVAVSSHLKYARSDCRLRDKPLSPALSPVQAVEKLTTGPDFKAIFRKDDHPDAAVASGEERTIASLRRQALRAVSNLHPFPIGDPYYLDSVPYGCHSDETEAKWPAHVNAVAKLTLRWDRAKMEFQPTAPRAADPK